MIDVIPELRSRWNEVSTSEAGGREWRAIALGINAPVRLFAAVRDRDNRVSVLVETPLSHAPKHRIRFHAEGISLSDQRASEEGLMRLAVTLERPDLRDIFEVLAADLIATAGASSAPEQAMTVLVRRLEAWQTCLRVRHRGLAKDEQAGLLGELTVLLLVAEEIGLTRALGAWLGPLGAIHDFEGGGVAIEVKATIGISHHIHVSRLDQLDSRALSTLVLLRVKLQESPAGATLPEQVAAVRATLAQNFPAALSLFEDGLLHAGYLDVDADLYGSIRITPLEIQGFLVRDSFPCLTREGLPTAIVDAAYVLDELQLAAFRLTEDDLRAAFRRMRRPE